MYSGVKEVVFDDEQLSDFYSGKFQHDLFPNQYLIIKDVNGKVLEKYRNNRGNLLRISKKKIGRFSPKNDRQECTFDLLLNKDIRIKLLLGGFGVGENTLL